MIILERYDDLDYARDKTKTLATHVDVPLTWGDKSVTLDLSEENYQRVTRLVTDLVKAGTPAGKPAEPARTPYNGKLPRGKGQALRQWARDNKIMARSGPERYAYLTPGGSHYYYPPWLIEAFEAAHPEAA